MIFNRKIYFCCKDVNKYKWQLIVSYLYHPPTSNKILLTLTFYYFFQFPFHAVVSSLMRTNTVKVWNIDSSWPRTLTFRKIRSSREPYLSNRKPTKAKTAHTTVCQRDQLEASYNSSPQLLFQILSTSEHKTGF